MGYWSSRGLRGSELEEYINLTNDVYKEKGLAIIQKIPTPITPVELDKEQGNIKLAYFDKKSTIDYMGVVQGIPICFDAKQTANKSLPIQNIHPHQVEFMEQFEKHKGISFLIVRFSSIDKCYFLPFETLKDYWEKAQNGGRKSIPLSAFDEKYLIKNKGPCVIHYLDALNTYLNYKKI